MLKLKKIIKILFIITLLGLLYKNTFGNYFFVLKLNWNFKLPTADKVIYMSRTEPGFHGDGFKYLITKYKSKSKIKKLDNIDWNTEKDENIEKEIFQVLDTLKIDKEHLINFDNQYKHYEIVRRDYSKLFLIYMKKEEILYIIEVSL